MKSSIKKTIGMFIPILILCFVVSVSAQDIFRALGNERLIKELNLAPEQKEALKNLRMESKERMIDIEAQMKKGRLVFDQEMEKEDVNKEKVMELIEQMGNAQTEMKKISVTQLIEAKKILTQEQREKAKDLISKWKAHQARQKFQARDNKPDRPNIPNRSGRSGDFRPGQRQQRGDERPRFAPGKPDPDRNRQQRWGDRSELMEFPHDSRFENDPEKNVAELVIPDSDFDE